MSESPPVVGAPDTHKRFLDGHVPLLIEFPEIQNLANKLWDKALERYNQRPEEELQGEQLRQDTAIRLAQIIVFYLARTAFDGFYDVFILAGNCRGCTAKMMLRVIYEHADLIVLGSHGRTGMTRLFMGSVSEAVARHAGCSVQIVRIRPAAEAAHPHS